MLGKSTTDKAEKKVDAVTPTARLDFPIRVNNAKG